ncbi:hypothetical protein F3Y22_tig00008667pilonHSYRG00009 [Hibiscus syriacus]|uniref:F-box domain-containing protein n=1 Tax=Hibiscus syriacus TaxID=106335 RepID=A0A6A3CAC2_HIBSY|nr:hypothetical protein F3Y22_tig00008667pilonHSYRG00009 [Hibiscus syriacus]
MNLPKNPSVDNGNGRGFKYLVDDLVTEILRRLPAEHLWRRCRLVCRRWNALISSPSFAYAHLQQSPSTVFGFYQLVNKWYGKVDFFLPHDDDDASLFMKRAFNGALVERWKHQTAVRAVVPIASCNGLVLFKSCMFSRSSSEFYVGNPITGELITLIHPYRVGCFCGFFYHSPSQEYRLLHCRRITFECEYAILTLGSTKWRTLCTLPYCFRQGSSPVILGNALYWMTGDPYTNAPHSTCEISIMKFSMETEEFHTLSHPSYRCETERCDRRSKLLEMDGRLTCWCLLGQVVHVWLFNHTEWHWTRIYDLDFNRNFKNYIFPCDLPQDNHKVQLVRIRNKKLILFWPGIGVFCYSLLTDNVEMIELEGIERFHYDKGQLLLTGYTKSVISAAPAEHLWRRCRLIFRGWNALLSSPSFAHAHLQQSPTVFAFYQWYSRSSTEFYVGNPITGELITLIHPYKIGCFCGFFYDSRTQEYRLLHCRRTGSSSTDIILEYEYATLTLGSTKWRTLCTLPYGVRLGSSPVILNNTLYWMTGEYPHSNATHSTCENSIMMFSMETEEFHTMSLRVTDAKGDDATGG